MKASEFKAKCLKVLDEVERTGEAVELTKRGKIVARVVSARALTERPTWRLLRGKMEILGDIVGPVIPPEHWNAVKGKI
jgi:prevent-host-death family protein